MVCISMQIKEMVVVCISMQKTGIIMNDDHIAAAIDEDRVAGTGIGGA